MYIQKKDTVWRWPSANKERGQEMKQNLLTPWFWTSSLQHCELRICYLTPPSLVLCMATVSNGWALAWGRWYSQSSDFRRFHVYNFVYLIKIIGNPKSILAPLLQSFSELPRAFSQLRLNALSSCFSPHCINKCPSPSLFKCDLLHFVFFPRQFCCLMVPKW